MGPNYRTKTVLRSKPPSAKRKSFARILKTLAMVVSLEKGNAELVAAGIN